MKSPKLQCIWKSPLSRVDSTVSGLDGFAYGLLQAEQLRFNSDALGRRRRETAGKNSVTSLDYRLDQQLLRLPSECIPHRRCENTDGDLASRPWRQPMNSEEYPSAWPDRISSN
jgi:hypothetical protein